jgi:alpha-mannosidase
LCSLFYAHHDPTELDPDADYRHIDQGEQTFIVGLYPHAGTWADAGTVQRAIELNRPPIALIATGRPEGTLPLSASYLQVTPANIVVSALKQAEEGDDLILRAYESAGRAAQATLRLFDRRFEADFRPGEIKSWRIPTNPARAITEVDFIEDPRVEGDTGQGREAA